MLPRPSFKSNALIFLAVVVAMLPFVVVAFAPQIPIYMAVLVALLIGGPCIVGSIRYQERELAASAQHHSPSMPDTPRPTVISWQLCLAWLVCIVVLIAPVLVLLLGLYAIPVGDQWPLVIARISYLITAFILVRMWWKVFCRQFATWSMNWFPDDVLQSIHQQLNPPAANPTSGELIRASLPWLAVGILSLVLASGVVDLNAFQIKNAPRKLRGLAAMIDWCRGNPNFTRATFAIASIVSWFICLQNLWTATRRWSSGVSTARH